ncbi:TrkH family potassium uptake protein [Marasmitruncus massiliensis]|uniref:TrkH family potassium uptake protein n=1 Tax=Marasmitruncus massiliensis TaxID=1944642 RepID=UPI000C7BEF63|nr:TrkH family potassium uptake protein [Marasmitruncus massiliensis]
MNFKMVVYLIGHILRLEALFMVPAMAISFFGKEPVSARAFFITIMVLLSVSLFATFRKPKSRGFYTREGFLVTALAWMVMSLFGALPFFISGEIPNYLFAVFETVSGLTTTGASILKDVEVMSKGMLYWRSFTHWLGGMGILVFLLAILPMTQGSGSTLHIMRAESPGPEVGKLVPRLHQMAKILYLIYCALTVMQMVLLLLGDMPLFDTVCITFGTAGTGGFGVLNSSCADYSPYCQIVITVFMMLFGVNFSIFYLLLMREFSQALLNQELRVYLGIMLSAVILVTVNILPVYRSNLPEALRYASFQVASIMTTTGFATADFNLWPQLSRSIMVVLMVLGASAGSTGGGIKSARVLILFQSAKQSLRKMLNPREVNVVKVDGKALDDEVIEGVHVYMTIYCAVAAVSFLIVSLDNFSLETNLTAVLSCLNNIGPGLGEVGPTGNFSGFSAGSTVVLILNMLIGRLEIFPMLFLFAPSNWKRTRVLRPNV